MREYKKKLSARKLVRAKIVKISDARKLIRAKFLKFSRRRGARKLVCAKINTNKVVTFS